MEDNKEFVKKWYIIHTYSGYEKRVKEDLEKRIVSLELTDRVFRILVPEEEVFEEKRGIMVKVTRKLFPSYVMVEMRTIEEKEENSLRFRVDSEAWYVIRNTNGVTGFVGVGSDPIPMTDEEVDFMMKRIGMEGENILNLGFEVGDYVLVTEGPFEGKEVHVEEIDYDKLIVRVTMDLFGRLTPVQVNVKSLEKIKD